MKHVEIYDQYKEIADSSGTILHPGTGSTVSHGIFDNELLAKEKVKELYESSKLLGSYEDKYVNFDKGYAELKIEFLDGKKLNRVIYIIDK